MKNQTQKPEGLYDGDNYETVSSICNISGYWCTSFSKERVWETMIKNPEWKKEAEALITEYNKVMIIVNDVAAKVKLKYFK